MRIVAVNRFFWPDHSATSQLLTDLAERLATSSAPLSAPLSAETVTIVTSRMLYDDPQRRLAAQENHRGIRIIRVWSSRFGRDFAPARAIDYLTFYLSATLALMREVTRGDLLLAKTDPPLISVAAAFVAAVKGAKLVNWCQDLFPEVAGMLDHNWANGPLGRGLRMLRNWSLRRATVNVALSDKMAERLQAEGVPSEKIEVVPNWCDEAIRPVSREENSLIAGWDLTERRVIGYSGNLGRAHIAEAVADLVRRTADLERLTWLFIGGGKGLETVKAATADLPEGTVHYRPYQPLDRLSESLSVPDLHLVSLAPGCEGLIMPSKVYGVIAVGRPILFLGSPDGAVAELIDRYGNGAVLDLAAPEEWRQKVETWLLSPPTPLPLGTPDPALGRAGLDSWIALLHDIHMGASRRASKV
ncbi:colanic acid biosynthesis glycosyl transferase, putative [Parvularcula bermudensis HTCC2503]|uniref:Colanic acid biosynthesis glycosyl transferase, putative n=1 Tax=Parvularcula bermudensis (strain ATCC BAA-594 / HTCC2503 / KCTC 12087) TaxID=314260 RepID=E0TCG5_PARBH|nr:colanic acid biosynthesis glycosyl transferase, putative [Parvularcula bermudensis HTCC2503]